MNDISISGKFIVSILFFPVFFQGPFLEFAWGAQDELWVMWSKRVLLLLPVFAIILGCWSSVATAVTVLFRQDRKRLITSLVITWWDLGRAIFTFWGGILKFGFYLFSWLAVALRVVVFGLWLSVQDILMAPLRMAASMGKSYIKPGVPWLALLMTFVWSAFEAGLFTYVTTSLVQDVLSGMSGKELSANLIQFPLYFTMFVLVIGSYAVLSSWSDALKSRDWAKVFQIGVIEFVVLGFEVLFLYREFVDALVPWLAQYTSADFELGLVGTLSIAGFAWLGVRAMTWFAFASSGTPMIMSIIQRTGLDASTESSSHARMATFAYINTAFERIKSDMDWIHKTGNDMLSAFILPPLQIVAACINFLTLVVVGDHIFDIPFKSIHDITEAKQLIKKASSDNKNEAA